MIRYFHGGIYPVRSNRFLQLSQLKKPVVENISSCISFLEDPTKDPRLFEPVLWEHLSTIFRQPVLQLLNATTGVVSLLEVPSRHCWESFYLSDLGLVLLETIIFFFSVI